LLLPSGRGSKQRQQLGFSQNHPTVEFNNPEALVKKDLAKANFSLSILSTP